MICIVSEVVATRTECRKEVGEKVDGDVQRYLSKKVSKSRAAVTSLGLEVVADAAAGSGKS